MVGVQRLRTWEGEGEPRCEAQPGCRRVERGEVSRQYEVGPRAREGRHAADVGRVGDA